jgi:hypothetical protein
MSFPISTRDSARDPGNAGWALTRVVSESLPGPSEGSECERLVLEVKAGAGNTLSTLALAGRLAQLEEHGDRVSAVRLLIRAREDADWAVALIEWLGAHQFVALVRTRVRLRGDLVECLRHESVHVEFELAHHKMQLQRALLDGAAESVQSLLLQSQHLSVIGIQQSVRLGPLLPGVHDEDTFRRLLALVRGADLHDYDLFVGQLGADALALLGKELGSAQALALTRSFGVSPMVLFEGLEATLRLPALMRRSLVAAYERLVTAESGLQHKSALQSALAGLDEQGRGAAFGSALALELFSRDPSLVAS